MKYPYPCCRCGFCCLTVPCPVFLFTGRSFEPGEQCPEMSFDGEVASCGLAELVPFGEGCCIKARAYKDGSEYDFAALPPEFKRIAAQDFLKKKGR